MAEQSVISSRARVQSRKQFKAPSTGPRVAERDTLVERIELAEKNIKFCCKLFIALAKTYPADAHHVETIGKGFAAMLMQEAMNFMKDVKGVPPESPTGEDVRHA